MVLAVVVLSLISAVIDAAGSVPIGEPRGTYGLEFNLAGNRTIHVVSVLPTSPAAAAGIRAGDDLRLVPPASYFDTQAPALGARLTVEQAGPGGTPRSLAQPARTTLVAVPTRARPFDVEWALIRLMIVLGALVIVLGTRSDDRAGRALAVFLSCIGLLCNWRVYPGAFATVGFTFRDAAQVVGFPYFLVFAARFVAKVPGIGTPRLLGRSYEEFAAILGAIYLVAIGTQSALYLESTGNAAADWLVGLVEIALFVLGIAVLFVGRARALGAMRERIEWILATMAVSLGGPVLWLLLGTGHNAPAWRDELALPMALLPVGLAYATLRHRVLDVTFAINRAIAWTIIATALVPVFGLLEWALNEIIKALGGREIDKFGAFFVVVNAAASVAVFASLRVVHEHVDRGVKKFLFRERDLTLARMKQASTDVRFVSNSVAAAEFVARILDENLRVSGTAVYWKDSGAFALLAATTDVPQRISENDDAVLRLNSQPLCALRELRTSAIPGAFALPMARGSRLCGFCAIPFGNLDRSIAPDLLNGACALVSRAAERIDELEVAELQRQLSELRLSLQLFAQPRIAPVPSAPTAS